MVDVLPFGSGCILDHWAGEAATGSGEAKKVDLLKSSSSLSSDKEVVDCAGEGCLYIVWRIELECEGGDLIVVCDNEAGSTWASTREEAWLMSADSPPSHNK